ncbi:MAG TPA: right-handed parallel beta-helix repeat-containing protein [Methanoregulaceae archaeon]|nr:right-handed parallel beta-helix repeat-containing protein [Methanoregulaceae archaeon]HPW10210.1 right-handed parallel beta-helix repeat-containing protein [Methanoregulaceae archaeon]
MTRWPCIGKSRVATAILVVLCCMLLFQACSAADCGTDPDIKDVKLYVDCDYEFYISFHSDAGLQADTNGFWVFFDKAIEIDPTLAEECVQIKWEGHSNKPAADVAVYGTDELPVFAPANASQAVKIWISESIPMNKDVTIWFKCGLSAPCDEPDCPFGDCITCDELMCYDFTVWVANDLQRCPQISTRYVKIIASSGPGGHVTYPPTGESAAPDFEKMFKVGSTPTYLITGESHIIDKIVIEPLCEGVPDPEDIIYKDCEDCTIIDKHGSVQATYTFDELHCSYKITATFIKKPVYGYLKYQLPLSECGDVVKVKVWGTDKLQPMLDFADDLYIGGNSAVFNLEAWDDPSTVLWEYGGSGDVDTASGVIPEVVVKSAPVKNPETFMVTYEDTNPQTPTQHATVTILTNGQWVWAPSMPDDVKDIINVEAQEPAWDLVTQNYLDCNPEFEGLIGMVIEADDSKVYTETIEIDTPGVLLKNKEGTAPVIDAKGLTPKKADCDDSDKSGAVYLSSGSTGIEGFTIKNSKTNGVLVWLCSEKCEKATILDSIKGPGCNEKTGCKEVDCDNIEVPCCQGRINIVKNDIVNNCENGIYVNDAVVLISENKIHGNIDDGIDAGCLFCGVETIDPAAITHSPACSEIILNEIYHNGHFPETGVAPKGEWVVEKAGTKYFTSDPTACGKYPGWTDAGIQIRCVGDRCGEPCSECRPNSDEPTNPEDLQPCGPGPCAAGTCCSGTCPAILAPDWEGCGGCNMTLYIVHNNVTDNFHAGVYLMEGATQGGQIIIQANQIHENGVFGLLTEAAIPSRIDFKWNDIWCNKYWGVKNLACCDLVAKENYWGSPGGPSAGPAPIVDCIDCRCHELDQRSNALGNGDEVSHRVHYDPWLYRSAMCMLDGSCTNIRIYGSQLPLQCGWNTLSVPVTLADEANTIPKIATLGKFITRENIVVVYKWDAEDDVWVNVGASGEEIIPGQGYYIKMKSESMFPVLYNAGPSPGLSAISLESGWNLIGAPWGIDREDGCCDLGDQGRWGVAVADLEDDEAFKQVTDALESIKEGNGGTKGVAIIVSPSVPGQYEAWSASVTSGFWDPVKNTQEMATGDAYWVFMANPATYAGFEITPFYFPAETIHTIHA